MAIPVYIIANQRSGTNFLRNVLVSTGFFTDLNEIFQSNEPSLFWDFYMQAISKDPQLARPSKPNRQALFDQFHEECIEPITTRYALVDLKYNTTHNLNSEFQPPSEAPFLFELLKKRICHVVHLVRENSLENYVSNMLANKTGQYCAFKEDSIIPEHVQLSPNQTLIELKKCQDDIERFRHYIAQADYGNQIELSYSEISRLNHADKGVQDRLCAFFDLPANTSFSVKTRKIAKKPSEIISNYKEDILPVLMSSPYARFAY